jgi:hypothetical protein
MCCCVHGYSRLRTFQPTSRASVPQPPRCARPPARIPSVPTGSCGSPYPHPSSQCATFSGLKIQPHHDEYFHSLLKQTRTTKGSSRNHESTSPPATCRTRHNLLPRLPPLYQFYQVRCLTTHSMFSPGWADRLRRSKKRKGQVAAGSSQHFWSP